jgi:glutathione synthase/RimK-type ligase-like ATP-grasp enzyme
MSRTDFTFITYKDMLALDPDDRLVLDVLSKRGYKTQGVVWDDESVDWAKAGHCVIRSTWDYHLSPAKFLSWVDSVAKVTTIWNDPLLVRWNCKKTYMHELAECGVRIVPTLSFKKGSHIMLKEIMRENCFETAIVKPTVGLATYGVKKVSTRDIEAGQKHVDKLLKKTDILVQPYLASVEDYGERALIFIEGEYSHAVRKRAFQKLAAAGQEGETPATATEDELALAKHTVEAFQMIVPKQALYARVDMVNDEQGVPHVLELELVEPSLFTSMHPPSIERFADALCKRAK